MSGNNTESIPKILIFTRALGYRHDSTSVAATVLAEWGTAAGLWNSVHTEDPSIFTDESLSQFQAIVWVSTTGEIITGSQVTAFRKWLQNGGHFASIHAATNALTTESFYGNLTGAYFSGHPDIQNATYQVSNPTHPAVSMLPLTWEHYDEIYQYHQDPRKNNVTLLLSAIQSSYKETETRGDVVSTIQLTPGGSPQPIAWFREPGHQLTPDLTHHGRLFQTGLGHATETWLHDTLFRNHIYGGIQWLLGLDVTKSTAPPSVTATATEAAAVFVADSK